MAGFYSCHIILERLSKIAHSAVFVRGGIKYTAPVETSGFIFKKQSVASTALKKFKIEVSKDGSNWTTVKEGTLDLTVDNPTETIFFDQECTASIKSK